jgi:hypothetical protein
LSDLENYTYYILGPYGSLNEFPVPGLVTEAKAETEYVIEGEIIMEVIIIREETLPAGKTLTPLGNNKEYSDKECRLNELVSVNMFVIEDGIISDVKIFTDVVSY